MKTNAMRILDTLGIEYSILEYEIDDRENEKLALKTAQKNNIEPEMVYKTIVLKSSTNQIFVFVCPSCFEISLKKAKAITGCDDLDLLKTDLLLKTTGYIRGGCSPLGMKKSFPTFIEEVAQLEEYIYISAGIRGAQIRIKPDDLLKAANASYESFTN